MIVIDPEREAAVEQLLTAGQLSQRQVARRSGVGRGTVQAIASGQRPADLSRQFAGNSTVTLIPLRMCQDCGRVVEIPCVTCRAREARRLRQPRIIGSTGTPLRLRLRLRGEDRERYRAVRAARRANLGVVDAAIAAAEEEALETPLDGLEPTDEDLRQIEEPR